MSVFFMALGLMVLLVVIMSIGVIMGRKPISGSCGGMSALGMDVACDICGGDKNKCEKTIEEARRTAEGSELGQDIMADRDADNR